MPDPVFESAAGFAKRGCADFPVVDAALIEDSGAGDAIELETNAPADGFGVDGFCAMGAEELARLPARVGFCLLTTGR